MDRSSPAPAVPVRPETAAGWAAAAVTVLALYVVVVLGGGVLVGRTDSPQLGLSILATALVATLAEPVRAHVERWTAARLGGDRRSPYDVLAEFSREVAAGESREQAPAVIARMLVQGTGATWAQVWVLVSGRLRLVATYPSGAAADQPPASLYERSPAPGLRTVTVTRAGRPLGVLRVGEPEDRPLPPVEDRLLGGLAAQAGMVHDTARLRAELSDRADELAARNDALREARTALVTAQDRERRRLERDIHDGAQQQLVALAINLKVARALTATDATGARTTIEEQLSAVTEAIDTLSDLSRGLLPDVLAEQGLAAALTHVTVGNPVPVAVACAGLPRLSADLEATLYFCALEAVQNATKHAGARRIDVRIEWEHGRLALLVADDGTGFDPRTEEGTGLANMRERVGALGGTLRLTSDPRAGTAVRVDVPVDGPGVPPPTGPGAT